MPTSDPLAKYRSANKGRRRARCRVCGREASARVVVALQERKAKPDDTLHYPAIDSHSGSYCAEHAGELYAELVALHAGAGEKT